MIFISTYYWKLMRRFQGLRENYLAGRMAKPDSRKPVCFLPRSGAGRRGRLAGQLYSGKAVLLVISVRLEPKTRNGRQNPPPRCCWQTGWRKPRWRRWPCCIVPERITRYRDDGVRHCTGRWTGCRCSQMPYPACGLPNWTGEQRAALLSLWTSRLLRKPWCYELDAFLGAPDRLRRGCPSLRATLAAIQSQHPNWRSAAFRAGIMRITVKEIGE